MPPAPLHPPASKNFFFHPPNNLRGLLEVKRDFNYVKLNILSSTEGAIFI